MSYTIQKWDNNTTEIVYKLYAFDSDFIIQKEVLVGNLLESTYYNSNVSIETIAAAWTARASKTYDYKLKENLVDNRFNRNFLALQDSYSCSLFESARKGINIKVEDFPLLWIEGNGGSGYYDSYKGDTFEISGSGCVYGGSVADYELNTRINIDSRNLTTQLNEVFLSKFTELTDLAVQDNNIQIIEPRLNLKLVNLLCHTNDINNLVVYGLLNLRRLEFYDNNISVIDTVDLINLREIIGYQNNLTEVNLTNSTLLEKIILFSNEITTIDTTTNVLITELKIQSNLLTDINIANNILLKDIRLHNNRLSNIKNSDVLVTLNNFNSSSVGGYFQGQIFGGGSLTTAGAAAKASLQAKGWNIVGL